MRAIALILALSLLSARSLAATPEARETEGAAAYASHHARVVVTFANEPPQPPTSAGSTTRHYGGGGYLLAQSAHRQSKRVAAKYSLREVANWPIRALAVHCVVYEIPDTRPVSAVVDELARDSGVALAEPLSEFHTLTDTKSPYNDPLYDLQTNLSALNIAEAHAHSQGAGIRIALIDTGVDTQHPDLQGRVALTRSFVDAPARSVAAYRHGTAMAGLIAAVANNHVGIVGIAPQARLEVLEACWQLQPENDAAVCNTFTLAKALAAAVDDNVPLINMSIGGPPDPLLAALVTAALKHGAIVVGAAAGPAEAFPTSITGVITAQGLERPVRQDAFSVPADHILTLRPAAQYDFETGSSVAAAELTGVIALMLSANGGRLPRDALVSALEKTAAPAVDVNAALLTLEPQRRLAARPSH